MCQKQINLKKDKENKNLVLKLHKERIELEAWALRFIPIITSKETFFFSSIPLPFHMAAKSEVRADKSFFMSL